MTEAKPGPIIDVEGLGVRYGKTAALRDVSLQVPPGAVTALLGRNGAGKSSLVRCLLGHRKPSSGRVELLGLDSWRHRAQLMEQIGVVPEDPDAPPTMTAEQLGRFSARLYPEWDAKGYAARLQRFDVPGRIAFARLSKGQRAQIMLSLALAVKPRVLILDDPTLGLDAVARRAVFEELVVELADRELTVLITSHDLPGIESIASHVAILKAGELLLDEELEQLKSRFRRIALGRVDGRGDRDADGSDLFEGLGPLEVRSRGRGIEALVSRFDDSAFERLRALPDVHSVETWPATLEDIVIALTDGGSH
ncbi:MAG: ATP-binding cassette domain-containing protein [Acidobacteriota bacterium]